MRRETKDQIWEIVIIAFAVALFIAMFGPTAKAAELQPFVGYTHVSDITRGPPLHPPVQGCEPTTDWLGAGVTIMWPKFELDLAHGVKWRDQWCGKPYAQPHEQGTELAFRWYPLR